MATKTATETKGIRIARLISLVAVAVAIWFLPIPDAITVRAWHLFAIFVAFLFARAFTKTGLGRGIAYWFIRNNLTPRGDCVTPNSKTTRDGTLCL